MRINGNFFFKLLKFIIIKEILIKEGIENTNLACLDIFQVLLKNDFIKKDEKQNFGTINKQSLQIPISKELNEILDYLKSSQTKYEIIRYGSFK